MRDWWSVVLSGLVMVVCSPALRAEEPPVQTPEVASTCLDCHGELEPMHPEELLSCVDCHGGDPTAKKKADAHVRSLAPAANDERVAPQGENLAWRRFRNPMDLRVVDTTCGECHASTVHDLETGMHSTTAGHLSDGYYEMGLIERKQSPYGIFPVASHAAQGGELESLIQVPAFRNRGPRDQLSSRFLRRRAAQ